MEAKNFTLKAGLGKSTILDKAYSKHIAWILQTLDEETEERWETYNIIIEELLRQGKGIHFQEIKYRLTDGENPNVVMLDIINRDTDVDGLLWLLKRRVDDYLEADFIKRFY